MKVLIPVLSLTAFAAAGDLELGGTGQSVVTTIDGDSTLNTRLVLGVYNEETDWGVFGLSVETLNNLEDFDLLEAYAGFNLDDNLSVTVGNFQRHFSAEAEASRHGFAALSLTQSTAQERAIGDDLFVSGFSLGGELGDMRFDVDFTGDDVIDDANLSGRLSYGGLGFGFIGEDMDLWTVDFGWGGEYLSYTQLNDDDWIAAGQVKVINTKTFDVYGRYELDSDDVESYGVGVRCDFSESAAANLEYDDRDESVKFGLTVSF